MHVVLRSRSLRFLLLGQTLSSLGDRALIIAFGIWAKELTGSDGAAGVAFFFVAFPTLLAPFAGVVIDRYPRRRVFLFANLIMAGVLLLGLLVHGSGQLWLLYLIILCYGFSTIFIDPTQSTIIASIVPKSELADANGLLQTVSGGVRLLAPLIGAGLFTVVGGRAVAVIDAATFVMAALCVLESGFRSLSETLPPRPAGDRRSAKGSATCSGRRPCATSCWRSPSRCS